MSDKFDPADIQKHLGSIEEAISNCRTFKIWLELFHYKSFDPEDLVHMGEKYPHLADATLLFSLISVRRIYEIMKPKPSGNRLHWKQLGVDRKYVLDGAYNFISKRENIDINNYVSHLTIYGNLDDDALHDATELLERLDPALDRLTEELNRIAKEHRKASESASVSE